MRDMFLSGNPTRVFGIIAKHMFTKDQLQQLREVIREEVKAETEPINKRLDQQGEDIKSLNKRLERIEFKLDEAQKDIDTLIDASIKADIRREEQIQRIEDHLNLPSLEQPKS